MSNQRGTFAKRQREQNKKDKARAKQERLAARRAEIRVTKGPPIDWDAAAQVDPAGGDLPAGDPSPASPAGDAPNSGS